MNSENNGRSQEMSMNDLAECFSEIMFDVSKSPHQPIAKGFTVGRGKKLYWYITPVGSGYYRVHGLEEDGKLSWPRSVNPEDKVVVHF